jgi:hypothetical protein
MRRTLLPRNQSILYVVRSVQIPLTKMQPLGEALGQHWAGTPTRTTVNAMSAAFVLLYLQSQDRPRSWQRPPCGRQDWSSVVVQQRMTSLTVAASVTSFLACSSYLVAILEPVARQIPYAAL